jgi:hypothetical protein
LPDLYLLLSSLVLIWCWHLPLLIPWTILGIVAHIATTQALVPIALAEMLLLLRRLIVPWSGSWKASGCRLLLLRWPDHPSACLLLKSPALIVRNNPEPLGLSRWCCHWCLSLLLCPVSYNAILLGDGQVDQLIEAICPDSVESPQLGVETPAEAVSLLLIRIGMVTCILAQVVEGLSVLQYHAGSLIKCQKLIQLAIENSSGNVVPSESGLEFFPSHFMTSGEHSTEVVPPSPSRAMKLLRGKASLGFIRAVSCEEGKLGLNDAEPHVGVQRILCLGEQGWLRAHELLVGCRCRRSLMLASTMMLRVGLALQELSQNLILLGHQLLHCGSWRRWRGNLLVMPATLASCHLKTKIVAIVIPTHNFERQAIISYGRKNAIIKILGSK